MVCGNRLFSLCNCNTSNQLSVFRILRMYYSHIGNKMRYEYNFIVAKTHVACGLVLLCVLLFAQPTNQKHLQIYCSGYCRKQNNESSLFRSTYPTGAKMSSLFRLTYPTGAKMSSLFRLTYPTGAKMSSLFRLTYPTGAKMSSLFRLTYPTGAKMSSLFRLTYPTGAKMSSLFRLTYPTGAKMSSLFRLTYPTGAKMSSLFRLAREAETEAHFLSAPAFVIVLSHPAA